MIAFGEGGDAWSLVPAGGSTVSLGRFGVCLSEVCINKPVTPPHHVTRGLVCECRFCAVSCVLSVCRVCVSYPLRGD